MKHIKIYRIIGILVILSLMLMVLPVTPVFATITLAISPTEAQVGESITYSGSGYSVPVESYVDLYISDQLANEYNLIDYQVTRYYRVVYGCRLSDNGSYSGTFAVPTTLNQGTLGTASPHTLAASGTYYVYVTEKYVYTTNTTSSKVIRARTTLTIAQGATLDTPDPASGPAGTINVLITGSNFPGDTPLAFQFDTTNITPTSGHTTTLSSGLFLSYITIPSTATAGAHTITVTAGTSTASTTFTVTASPTIDTPTPSSGPPGTAVMLVGSNFPASAALTFQFDTTAITPTSGDAATRSTGIFISTITIPTSASAGAHSITATAGGVSASTTFTVTGVATPTLNALNPTSGPAGTSITISGTGFAASTALVFQFGTTTVTPTSGSTQTGSDGSFSSIIVVPSGTTAGTYTITVTAGATSDAATFAVTTSATTTPPTTTPATLPLSIDQEEGDYVGGTISIGASGFIPNSTVTVTIDGTEITEKDTDANGFVVITFKVPSIQYGEHTVIATDGTNIASANFTIESTAPIVPQPLLPAMGEAISSPAYFDWDEVTDISAPVTYKLQIATSNTFEPETILLDLSGITTSEYTLTEAEQLKLSAEVTYYWREKSVDAALNESIWTGAGEFTMIKPFEFTGWPLYLTMGLGGLILFLLGLWVGRRTAFYY